MRAHMRRWRLRRSLHLCGHAGFALLAACATSVAFAAAPTVTIYRCVAADGTVTIQNDARCPKGTREQKRVVETPPAARATAPATRPVPMVAMPPIAAMPASNAATPNAATAVTSTTRPATPDAGASITSPNVATPSTGAPSPGESIALKPAPMLYLCLTADAQRYYGDDAQSTRCAPLTTTGVGGSANGAGQSCEVVRDRCEPVAETERCAAWSERRRTAEQASLFQPERGDEARADLDRVDAAVAGTVCAR